MAATEAEAIYAKAAKERQRAALRKGVKSPLASRDANGKTSDGAGAAYNVSGSTVERCKFVKQNGTSALVDAVRRGKLPAKTAADFAHFRDFPSFWNFILALGRRLD